MHVDRVHGPLYTCPVRLFTPFVQEVLELFGLTYELRVGAGWAWWERVALPTDGGIDAQPAKMLAALAHVALVTNEELARDIRERRKRAESRR